MTVIGVYEEVSVSRFLSRLPFADQWPEAFSPARLEATFCLTYPLCVGCGDVLPFDSSCQICVKLALYDINILMSW